MLHVEFENCTSISFIEEDVEYLFSSFDGRRTTHAGRIGMAIAHYGPSGQLS